MLKNRFMTLLFSVVIPKYCCVIIAFVLTSLSDFNVSRNTKPYHRNINTFAVNAT